jgi:hypothetical protein
MTTLRDTNQIAKHEHEETLNAKRVVLVGGSLDSDKISEAVKQGLENIKFNAGTTQTPVQYQVHTVKVPEIIKETEIKEIPVVVKEIEVREIPVIVKEVQLVEIPKVIVQEKIVEVQVPVIVKEAVKIESLPVKLLLIAQTILGIAIALKLLVN